MNDMKIIQTLKDEKLCSIIRGVEASSIDNLAKSLIEGGIKCVEVTFNTHGAKEMIEHLTKYYQNDLLIGAGTVLDSETAKIAIDAGAQFVLSPTLNLEVIKLCLRYNVVPVPGVLTPTEALLAWENGARMIKIFPAGVVGSNYIKQIKGPLPQLHIMAVGAINKDNIKDMLEAGADCVGVGSEIVSKQVVEEKNFDEVRSRAKELKMLIG